MKHCLSFGLLALGMTVLTGLTGRAASFNTPSDGGSSISSVSTTNAAGNEIPLVDWAAVVAKYRLGSNVQPVVALIADSWIASSTESVYRPLVTNLQARYGPGGAGWVNVSSNFLWASPVGMTWGRSGTWTDGESNGVASAVSTSSDTASPGRFGVTSAVNTFVTHYLARPGGGRFTTVVNGGAATDIDTAAADFAWASVTNASLNSSSNNTIVLTITNAGTTGVTLAGVDCKLTSPGLRLHNLGYSGSTAASWLSAGTLSNVWQAGIRALAPNLVAILLGTNEKLNDTTPLDYTNNLARLVARIQTAATNADILIISPSDNGGAGTYTMGEYASAARALCDSLSLPYLDLYTALGSYTELNDRGLYVNSTHPGPSGGYLIADLIERRLGEPIATYSVLGIGTNRPAGPFHVASVRPQPAVSVNQQGTHYSVEVQHNGAAHGMFINIGGNGVGFHPIFIQGQTYGPKFVVAANGGRTLWLQKTATGSGQLLSVENRGTGLSAEFNNASTTFSVVTSNGWLGIGTSTPAAHLQVQAADAGALVLQAGTSNRPSLLLLDTNGVLSVTEGAGTSNVVVGGLTYFNDNAFTNHSSAGLNYTNLQGLMLSASVLTNRGDSERVTWGGTFRGANNGTNQLIVGFGTDTNVFDTGQFTNIAGASWELRVKIWRKDANTVRVYGFFELGGPTSISGGFTNLVKISTPSLGATNYIRLQARGFGAGAITNDLMETYYQAARSP